METFAVEVVAGQPEAIAAGILVGTKIYKNELLKNRLIQLIRGNFPTPGINPRNGGGFYTKPYESDTIVFSDSIQDTEYIKINTI